MLLLCPAAYYQYFLHYRSLGIHAAMRFQWSLKDALLLTTITRILYVHAGNTTSAPCDMSTIQRKKLTYMDPLLDESVATEIWREILSHPLPSSEEVFKGIKHGKCY